MKFNSPFNKLNTSYGRIAIFYDFLSMLQYGNVARRSRNYFLGKYPFKPKNPPIAACGTGDFVKYFIKTELPKQITINDISERMLTISSNKIKGMNWNGNLKIISGDLSGINISQKYDFISLNYILANFPYLNRISFLTKISKLLSDSGIFQITDFSRPTNQLFLPLFHVNWSLINLIFWIIANEKPNSLGDMEECFNKVNLLIIQKKAFIGGLYTTWLLKKKD